MGRQYYQDLLSEPPIANLTAVTATAETALWSAAQFSAIPANYLKDRMVLNVRAGGIMSFAATGTLTITPRFGLTVSGTTLGASVAKTTPGVTTSAAWLLDMDLIVRSVGAPGANSVVIAAGVFMTLGGTAANNEFVLPFGGTAATVDVSVATGITIGWTLSVAGTVTPQWAYLAAKS